MKYKIKKIEKRLVKRQKAVYVLRKTCMFPTPSISLQTKERTETKKERISFSALFDLARLEGHKKRRFLLFLRSVGIKTKAALSFIFCKIRSLFRSRPPRATSFFLGSLCAVLSVAIISSSAVFFGLFGKHLRSYSTLTVPDLLGKYHSELLPESYADLEFSLRYEYSDTVPEGMIIEQDPSPFVTRKLFSGDEKYGIALTVSKGRDFTIIKDLRGLSLRDAKLYLKNSGVVYKTVYEYSDTVESGKIISTLPVAEEKIYSGDSLSLFVSMGKEIKRFTVPNLYGLSEPEAIKRLMSSSFSLGSVRYVPSEMSAGLVISQSPPPYASLAEGTKIDLTVSAGPTFNEKTVPNLYGLTLEEAGELLMTRGFLLGEVYSAGSGTTKGIVVAQFPPADSSYDPTDKSVDIYISY